MNDEALMKRALMLAEKGISAVSPNPMVGAVFAACGRVLGESWHKKFGQPHAEVLAIEAARKKGMALGGATLYINLEPCVAFDEKKTPSCAASLAKSGISRLVVAMQDPNPRVLGKGIALLKRHGIKVQVGVLRREAQKLNEAFIHWMKTGRPFVGMKVAASLDGRVATKTGQSQWITGSASRAYVRELRDRYDAILVGVNTVLNDNPNLKGASHERLRIILDSHLKTSLRANVLRNQNVLVVTTQKAPLARQKSFLKANIPLKIFPKKIVLAPLLQELGKKGISSILVEGGSGIFSSFWDEKLVNRLYWFVAPKIIGGGSSLPAISGKGIASLSEAQPLIIESIRQFDSDLLIEGTCSSL